MLAPPRPVITPLLGCDNPFVQHNVIKLTPYLIWRSTSQLLRANNALPVRAITRYTNHRGKLRHTLPITVQLIASILPFLRPHCMPLCPLVYCGGSCLCSVWWSLQCSAS